MCLFAFGKLFCDFISNHWLSAPTLSPFDITHFIVTTFTFWTARGSLVPHVRVCVQSDIIPLRISIMLLRSKHCSAGLLLRVGLIGAG